MISACGFQLRGTGTHSLSGTHLYLNQNENLDSDNNLGDFKKAFRRGLKQSGVELVNNASVELSIVEFNIVNLDLTSQGVSRDATGRANEHQVTLRLDYQLPNLISKHAKAQVDQNASSASNAVSAEDVEPKIYSISVAATYYQDYRNPIAGRVQKNETQKSLISQLTQRLIRQLEFKLKN